jgi:heterodisulfide reductase subunit B
MKYAFFLGCTVPVRNMNYELAARKVAEQLGIELVDSDAFTCCGYPMKGVEHSTALLLAARNLITAQEMGLDILTLCTACSGTLTEASKTLNEDEALRQEVNEQLERSVGKRYDGGVRVRHIARVLYEDVGLEQLATQVRVPLDDFRFGAQYGCHYLKPSEVFDGFDDPEVPQTLDELIAVTGAEAVDYTTKLECCGGGLLAMDEEVALAMPYAKLHELSEAQVDAMVLVCPFCDIMYEYNQRRIGRAFDDRLRLPVLFYPQILGLALGIPAEELGFRLNRVKSRGLMKKLDALQPA